MAVFNNYGYGGGLFGLGGSQGGYYGGGMGDGGGCHPRDNIAMSWLAKNLDLSYDDIYNMHKNGELVH